MGSWGRPFLVLVFYTTRIGYRYLLGFCLYGDALESFFVHLRGSLSIGFGAVNVNSTMIAFCGLVGTLGRGDLRYTSFLL